MKEITVVVGAYTQASLKLEERSKEAKQYRATLGTDAYVDEPGVIVTRNAQGKIVAVFDALNEETVFKITFTGLESNTKFDLILYPSETKSVKVANFAGIVEFRFVVAAGEYIVLTEMNES